MVRSSARRVYGKGVKIGVVSVSFKKDQFKQMLRDFVERALVNTVCEFEVEAEVVKDVVPAPAPATATDLPATELETRLDSLREEDTMVGYEYSRNENSVDILNADELDYFNQLKSIHPDPNQLDEAIEDIEDQLFLLEAENEVNQHPELNETWFCEETLFDLMENPHRFSWSQDCVMA